MKKIFWLFNFICIANILFAQNWDYIRSSGEFYYGVGTGQNEAEADQGALANLTSQIATHVSSDFLQIDDITSLNGNSDHKSKVLNCVRTYSQSTLTNTEKWVVGEPPKVTVRRYLKRSELTRIFENRIAKASDMVLIASECLQKGKIDMALQYYYWAYSLVRSVQFPSEVKDEKGRILVDWIPVTIDEILSDISIYFERKDGDYVDLLFKYKGEPVSSLEFTYSDGRADCQGIAKDGRGMIEMIPGYETNVWHLNIEYEYKGQARGDAEMESVLAVISPKVFSKAEFKVECNHPLQDNHDSAIMSAGTDELVDSAANAKYGDLLLSPNMNPCAVALENVINAISSKNYSNASPHFTIEGLEMFNKLISYGTGRIVDQTELNYFKGSNGCTVVRGLQMSFTFNGRKKVTYVEDVVFTFNSNNKIENIAFGLGEIAEKDILCRYAPGWSDDTREMLIEFLENYKTAYNLERLDYISEIFADDAVIIIGNVAKRRLSSPKVDKAISIEGQEVISYNRYTKDQYLKNLRRCFNRNDYINIRFTNNEIQWLEKYDKEEIFAIQIGQEYNSSTYADKGYLFLIVDMTNHNEPQIKIRTWQPNEVAMEELYHAGYFYNE